MRAAPAIALLVVGAALLGGALELLTAGPDRQTMAFDDVLAALGTWFLNRFMAIARIMKKH